MVCVRCWKKLKLRSDGMRRCGSGCSEVMGLELRIATLPKQIIEQPAKPSTFKLQIKPTWKSCNA